jgi:pyruvate/2-oxoglutarate dehydrogenase complex dihydrolipoamide dehydrogenase (E3) component
MSESVQTARGQVEVDEAFHGTGREPDLEDLDLGAGRVEHSGRGVTSMRS